MSRFLLLFWLQSPVVVARSMPNRSPCRSESQTPCKIAILPRQSWPLMNSCRKTKMPPADYLTYLKGRAQFYLEDYPQAIKTFSQFEKTHADSPWFHRVSICPRDLLRSHGRLCQSGSDLSRTGGKAVVGRPERRIGHALFGIRSSLLSATRGSRQAELRKGNRLLSTGARSIAPTHRANASRTEHRNFSARVKEA